MAKQFQVMGKSLEDKMEDKVDRARQSRVERFTWRDLR
jgi:hypothetical protein